MSKNMKSERYFAEIVCVVGHHYCAWKRSQRWGFHIAGSSCAWSRRRSGHSCCANWQDLWCYCYCSCQEKAQLLKDLGADYVVDPSDGGLIKSVQAFLKSKNLKGVDVLYDPVGGKLFKDSMKLLKWGAHILIIGFASGEIPTIPANIVLVKNWTVHGLYWGSYFQHKPEVLRESTQELLEMLGKGTLRVNVSHTFSLDQANEAFAAIQQRQVMGKVMILPGEKLDDMNSTTTGAISKL
jgi:D-arabinose 1-dehydrogenase-like Zn-dependent alcohol dehydrogenase